MTRFFILGLLICRLTVSAQENKYQKDFDYLIEALVATHPDPYSRFGNQIEFFRTKQKLKEELHYVESDKEFIALLNKFLSKLKDGHTRAYYNDTEENKEIKYCPLDLKAASDKLFVQNTTDEYIDLIGKQIVAVNGVPVENLLKRATQVFPAENISGAYYNLINLLSDDRNIDQILDNNDRTNFTFLFQDCEKEIHIAYQKEINLLPEKSSIKIEANNELLYWSMIGKNRDIAYFAWSFISSREIVEQIYRDNPKYTEINLNSIYSQMGGTRTGNIEMDIKNIPALYEQFYLLLKKMNSKGSKNLIIDLRSNSGGMTPLTRPLYYMLYGEQYLSKVFQVEYITKISPLYMQKLGFENIDSLNNKWNTNFKIGDYRFTEMFRFHEQSLPVRRKSIESGYYQLGGEYIKKATEFSNLKPNIIVLTSPTTFSASYHFLYFLKCLGNTTVIGTASRQSGNAFMETTRFEMPNTKIQASISNSWQQFFKNDSEHAEILRPDFEMSWGKYKEYNFDRNAEILYALDMIENGILKMGKESQ